LFVVAVHNAVNRVPRVGCDASKVLKALVLKEVGVVPDLLFYFYSWLLLFGVPHSCGGMQGFMRYTNSRIDATSHGPEHLKLET
jgi:hypothetical protein